MPNQQHRLPNPNPNQTEHHKNIDQDIFVVKYRLNGIQHELDVNSLLPRK